MEAEQVEVSASVHLPFEHLDNLQRDAPRAGAGHHAAMPDLHWDQVRDLFDPGLMGALPDLFVPDATVQDWQAVLDLVTTSGWQWQFEIDCAAQPLLTAASVFAQPRGAETTELKVWPNPGVLAIFRLWSETEISFDVDLRELQGQQGVDTLCAFLHAIGSRLGKPVLMTSEGGSQERPVLGYDPALARVILRTES
jgi:hypothetical protein